MLQNYISSVPNVAEPTLPLIHTTLSRYLPSIMMANELKTTACPVFGRDLLYTFYGRPAYESKQALAPTAGPPELPVCFVLQFDEAKLQLDCAYPFDSGAAAGNIFAGYIPAAQMADYQLAGSIQTCKAYVAAFFADNARYFSGTAVNVLAPGPSLATAQNLHALVTAGWSQSFDDRRSAVEVILKASVDFEDGTLLAVVVPSGLLEDVVLRERIRACGCDIIPYSTVVGSRITQYTGTVRDRVNRWLGEKGKL